MKLFQQYLPNMLSFIYLALGLWLIITPLTSFADTMKFNIGPAVKGITMDKPTWHGMKCAGKNDSYTFTSAGKFWGIGESYNIKMTGPFSGDHRHICPERNYFLAYFSLSGNNTYQPKLPSVKWLCTVTLGATYILGLRYVQLHEQQCTDAKLVDNEGDIEIWPDPL